MYGFTLYNLVVSSAINGIRQAFFTEDGLVMPGVLNFLIPGWYRGIMLALAYVHLFVLS